MTYNRWRIRNDSNQRKKFIFYSYYVRRKKGPETKLFVITRDKYGIGRERRDVIWSVHRLCIPYRCINFSSFAKGSTFFRVFSLPSALFSFIRSFIYSFFSFFFFFASILHHPPFFSATPLKATQYLTRVKMTYIWSSVFFFFFSPLKRSTLKRESTIRIASQEWNSRLKNRLHTRLIVSPSFRRGLPSIYTLDSFLTCVPRNRPRNRCNYASRNLLFLIVDFSILSFHIVEKPRTNLKASFPYLLVGGQASICPQFLEDTRLDDSPARGNLSLVTRTVIKITVYTPAPWNCECTIVFNFPMDRYFGRLTFFRATKRSNEENRVIFNTVDVLFKFGRIFHEYRS